MMIPNDQFFREEWHPSPVGPFKKQLWGPTRDSSPIPMTRSEKGRLRFGLKDVNVNCFPVTGLSIPVTCGTWWTFGACAKRPGVYCRSQVLPIGGSKVVFGSQIDSFNFTLALGPPHIFTILWKAYWAYQRGIFFEKTRKRSPLVKLVLSIHRSWPAQCWCIATNSLSTNILDIQWQHCQSFVGHGWSFANNFNMCYLDHNGHEHKS